MNCDEYRRGFEVALKGTLPGEWRAEEYRRHLVSCPQCQMLLALDEVAEAIAEVAEASPREDSSATARTVRVVRRKARRSRLLRASSVVVAALLLAGGVLVALRQSDEVGREDRAVIGAEAVSPEEFARRFESDAFVLSLAYQVRTTRQVFFGFERRDPMADQYEWAKKVLLAGLDRAFQDAPLFTASINEGGENLLKVQIRVDQLAGNAPAYDELSGVEFCRRALLLFDKQGLAKREDEE